MKPAAAWAWIALIAVLPFVAGIIFVNIAPHPTGHYYDSAAIAQIITSSEVK
jgi:hypothetical protein